MDMTRFAATLLLAVLGSTAAMAQEGTQGPAESRTRAEPSRDAARRAAEQEARTHSYGLFARNDVPSTTKTREEVRAELMEARAAEARLARGQRSN
jgi:hypothetical protein